jgi:hypothetical protein
VSTRPRELAEDFRKAGGLLKPPIRGPKSVRGHRRGFNDYRFSLPEPTIEGLELLVARLSRKRVPPHKRRAYPKTKNYCVTEALERFLTPLGFGSAILRGQSDGPRST